MTYLNVNNDLLISIASLSIVGLLLPAPSTLLFVWDYLSLPAKSTNYNLLTIYVLSDSVSICWIVKVKILWERLEFWFI